MEYKSDTCNWTNQDLEQMEKELANTRIFQEYPEGLLYFAFVCCVLFILIGIPGNFIIIIALARCKKIQSATATFIINLACSDMLFCCFNLPLMSTMYWQQSWPYGTTLCRIFPLANYGLVSTSLLSIMAIMVNRYILIAHPRLYPKIYTCYITVQIVGIWILSFGILIPTWFGKWGRFGMDFGIGSCTILPDCNNMSPKKILFVVAFLIPCLLILVCYMRIFCIVRNSTNRCSTSGSQKNPKKKREAKVVSVVSTSQSPEITNNQACPQNNMLELPPLTLEPTKDEQDQPAKAKSRYQFGSYISNRIRKSFKALKRTRQAIQPSSKDRKLLQMTLTIVVCFWVCYLPITFIKLFPKLNVPPEAKVLGYLLVYLTTCINPVIYVVMSSDYRQAYKSVFVCGCGVNPTMVSNNFRSQKPSQEPSREDRRSYVMTAV